METELAWAAGFYEKGASTSKQDGRKPRLQVKSNDGEMIERFRNAVKAGFIYGPYDYDYKDGSARKPYYVWVAEGHSAINVAGLLSPYLAESTRVKLNDVLHG